MPDSKDPYMTVRIIINVCPCSALALLHRDESNIVYARTCLQAFTATGKGKKEIEGSFV